MILMAGAYHAGYAVANIVQGLGLHPVSVPVDSLHSGTSFRHLHYDIPTVAERKD